MFKGTIESSTRALCKEANEDFVKAAKKWLEPPIPLTPSAPASCFADDESSGGGSPEKTPSQRPTHFSRLATACNSSPCSCNLDRECSLDRD